MRRVITWFVLVVVLAFVSGMPLMLIHSLPIPTVTLSIPAPPGPAIANGDRRAEVHHIAMRARGGAQNLCSSTAVGPHTLLSAAHCVMGSGNLFVDGKLVPITGVSYDEQDHVLFEVGLISFAHYAPIKQRVLGKHEHIRIWGWPGTAEVPVYREGFLMFTNIGEYIFQLAVYPGDSGSGIFSDTGDVIGVVSTGNRSAQTGAYRLTFTPQQLSDIR